MPWVTSVPLPGAAQNANLASWLADDVPLLGRTIAQRALADVGICEVPQSSNRGPQIDAYNRRAGVPVGSYWCASAVGAWWADAGAEVPAGYASCDHWMSWARKTGRWSDRPAIGAAALYGVPGDAQHIGVVVRLDPVLLDVEGNTSLAGYSRNGELVELKAVDHHRLLGFVHPEPKS